MSFLAPGFPAGMSKPEEDSEQCFNEEMDDFGKGTPIPSNLNSWDSPEGTVEN